MATFNADTDLGTQVITGSKVWSNGTSGTVASPTDIVFGSDTVDITATDITVVTNGITDGAFGNGSLSLSGCILNIIDPGSGGETRIAGPTDVDVSMIDTAVVGSLGSYATWGCWNTVEATWVLENFTLALDIAAGDAATLSIFTGRLNAASRFQNPSFWNGLTGAAARGGVWQTASNLIYNGVVTAPAGIDFNTANVRVFHRWAPQITSGTLTTANHTGCAPNFDFRSLQHIDNSAAAFFLDCDLNASMAHINWLPGVPINSLRHGFKSYWSAGRAQVFVATNPVLENPVGVDGDHLLNFSTADITSTGHLGVYLPTTEAWNPTEGNAVYDAEMITNKSQAVTTATLNGLYFRNQKFNETAGTQDTSATNFDEFIDLTPKTYRKYSWLQQPAQTVLNADGQTHREWMDDSDPLHVFDNFVPDDTQSSGFGKLLTIAVPPNNATEPQVQAARDGGYDIYNGTTWETSTDISDETDVIMRDANSGAFDTFNKAFAIGNGGDTGGFTTGSGVLAGMKALAYRAATGTSDGRTGNVDYVGTTNNLIETHYTVTGTTVDFDGILGLHPSAFDYRTANITIGGNDIENRFVRINHNGTFLQDEFVTAFTAEQIRINGDVDGSQANCSLSARDSIRFNSSISNLVLQTRKTDGLGTISAPDNDGPTPSLLTYDADIILARQPSGTYTTENLLGTGYTITGGAYNTLRTEVGTSYTIEATDANVAEFNLTQNADGTGGELQRGSSITVAPTGYGSITWNRPASPPFTYEVTIPTAKNGWYAIRQTTGGATTQHTAPTAFTANDSIVVSLSSGVFNIGDTFEIYLGYESVIGNNGNDAFYRGVETLTFPSEQTSVIAASPSVIAYPARLAIAPLSNETAVYDSASTSTVGLINITNTTNETGLDVAAPRAVGLAYSIVNTLQYFTLWYTDAHTNSTTADGITIGDGSTVIWNTDIITFQSGDEENATLPGQGGGPDVAALVPVQHFVRGWSADGGATGTFANARAGVAEINGTLAGSASLSQVQEASVAGTSAIVTKVDDVIENQTEIADAYNDNPLLADAGRSIDLPNKL